MTTSDRLTPEEHRYRTTWHSVSAGARAMYVYDSVEDRNLSRAEVCNLLNRAVDALSAPPAPSLEQAADLEAEVRRIVATALIWNPKLSDQILAVDIVEVCNVVARHVAALVRAVQGERRDG